jgi:D-alanine-D-alanine ligase
MNQNIEVLVLMGGWSSEREVSLVSGEGIANALKNLGYRVRTYDLKRDLQELLNHLSPRPNLIFNALHGPWGEDGRIQSVLDILNIPYTHSNAVSSTIAMHKDLTSQLCASVGIRVPKSSTHTWDEVKNTHMRKPPYVIKPVDEGSSVGVYIIQEGDLPLGSKIKTWPFEGKLLVEEYIPGRELTCPVLGDKVLPVIEICPHQGFYDYKHKYTEGQATHLVPAPIASHVYDQVQEWAYLAHRTLNCQSVTRSDFRYNEETDKLYFLEINTQPGFTPLSLTPESASSVGMTYEQLVDWIVQDALTRSKMQEKENYLRTGTGI